MAELPGILGEIEAAAGPAAALIIARERGGTELSLSDRPGSALVKLVGEESARKIVLAVGKGSYTIPMATVRGQGARRAKAAAMLAQGATETEVARACDVHVRTARRVRAKRKGSLPLFPED